ncbi:hypothetical protein QOM21_15165 [Streptomyces sp. Pv4-95]|uniref:hypothetical protein n=1 Tax=Streptomyces sp. Pv4-95 TaxID=3049543 RepID=UPI0038920576
MSTAAFHPVPVSPTSPRGAAGATALGAAPTHGGHDRHVLGNALRAVKVFVAAAFSVVVMGEYGDDDHADD